MKKCLLIAFAIIYPGWMFSQCIPSSSTSPGVVPSIQDNLPYAYVGKTYSTILQVRTPLDTTVNGTYVKLTSVKINGIANLPAGFTYSSNPSNGIIGPLQNGCMEISGNPTLSQAGTYILDIDMTVSGKLYGVIPVTQQTKLSDYKIKIFGPPVANFYTTQGQACAGQTVSFKNSSTNQPTSYNWTFTGGNPSTSTLKDPVVSYPVAGTYSVKLKVSSPAGSKTITKNALVHVIAYPNAKLTSYITDTICNGDSSLLSAFQVNSSTYQWYRNNVKITGEVNPSYYAKTSGAYTIKITKTSAGCATMSAADSVFSIRMNPTVTVAGSSKACFPGTVSLLAPQKPNLTYTWLRNNQIIPGANSYLYNATTTANYKVHLANKNGCQSESKPTLATINFRPTSVIVPLGPTTFCLGDNVILKNSNHSANASYSWTKENIIISGATTKQYVASKKGHYKSIVTTSQGCSTVSRTQYINVNCRLSADMDNQSSGIPFSIWPNPAGDHAILAFENTDEATVTVSVYDAIGKLKEVASRGIYRAGENEIYLNTSEYSPGIYFVRMESGNESKSAKLIIKN